MSLDVEVRTALGALRLEMKVQIEQGEVVALLGPNGAGKPSVSCSRITSSSPT